MNRNRIIAATVVVGLVSHLEKVPGHPRNGHSAIEQHANMTDSYSTGGDVDHTDADDRNIGFDVSI